MTDLQQAFTECGEQLDRIIDAYNRTNTEIPDEGDYHGFVPSSDPLMFRVTKNGIVSDVIQISGPPFSWFTTSASPGATYSTNGSFLFTIDSANTITVTADSTIGSITWNGGSCPYEIGETICTINRSDMIPSQINGYFEWRAVGQQ